MPRWKKVFLTVAIFLTVLGLGVEGFALLRSGGPRDRQEDVSSRQRLTSSGSPNLAQGGGSLTPWVGEERSPTGEPPPDASERTGMERWSPALMKGGMSFLVGFSIGYALRAFLKVSAAVVGLVLLAIFGLSSAGVLQVDWATIQTWFDGALATVKSQTAGFQTFVEGSLPSAGMAGAGLFTGIRKN
jgi:uncharacterized membrane protein (Fun14 family)